MNKVEIVIIGTLFNDLNTLGAEALNGAQVARISRREFVSQVQVGAYVLDYVWNDVRVAVRNTSENAENVLAVWNAKYEKTKTFVIGPKVYFTEEMRERELRWHERAISNLESQIAGKAEWLVFGVSDKDNAEVRAALASAEVSA